MGVYANFLPDAARLTGYPVVVDPNWRNGGHGPYRQIEIVVGHHTATPEYVVGDYPSLRVVRDGRAGLPGPLAPLGIGRSGTIYVMSNGVSYHAGVSAFAGFTDLNDEAIGIEAEDSGDGRWTDAQLDCYPRLVAAVLYYIRRGAERYAGHKTVALPRGRKIDPAGITDAWMRERAGWMLGDPLRRIPRTAAAEEIDMGYGTIHRQLKPGTGQRALFQVEPVGGTPAMQAAWLKLSCGWADIGDMVVHAIYFVNHDGPWTVLTGEDLPDGGRLGNNRYHTWEIPKGTHQVGIVYDLAAPGIETAKPGDGAQAAALITYRW